jgi:ABC-type molybdate transport system substrate-binding protein
MEIGAAMKTARLRAIMLLVGLGTANAAGATEIRIYCTGATAAAVKAIAADFSSQTKNYPVFTVGQPAAIEGDLAAGGKADIVVLPAPALAPLKASGALRADSAIDVARVGPLHAELQSYIVFDAAIMAGAAAPAAAASFIKMLAAPAERPAWQKAGLEPLGSARAE